SPTPLAPPCPGNIRELRNTIARTILLSPAGTFAAARLEPARVTTAAAPVPSPATLAEIQKAAARAMLAATGGNRSEAARRLGISRSRLLRLLERGDAN